MSKKVEAIYCRFLWGGFYYINFILKIEKLWQVFFIFDKIYLKRILLVLPQLSKNICLYFYGFAFITMYYHSMEFLIYLRSSSMSIKIIWMLKYKYISHYKRPFLLILVLVLVQLRSFILDMRDGKYICRLSFACDISCRDLISKFF